MIPDLSMILPPEIDDITSHLQLKNLRPRKVKKRWRPPFPPSRWPGLPSRSKITKMFPEMPEDIFNSDKPTSWSFSDDGVSINVNFDPGTVVEDDKVQSSTEATNQV